MMIVFSSLLAVIYVWRVVEVIYFQKPGKASIGINEAPLSMLVPAWLLIGSAFYFGIDATTTLEVAFTAAAALMR